MGIFTKPDATLDATIGRLERELEHAQTERDTLRRVNASLRKTLVASQQLQINERLAILAEHRVQVARLETLLRAETARADTATANFEWNRLMFNKSEQERAVLMQHVLRVPIMPFELAREPVAADDRTRPATSSAESGVAGPPGEATKTAIGGLAAAMGIDFEDVGDDFARALGVTNENPDGRIEHVGVR